MRTRAAQPLQIFHKFKVLRVRLNAVKRQTHLTHNFFSISVPGSAWFECRLWQYIFLFRKQVCYVWREVCNYSSTCLRLKYYEAKIQMLSVFIWKPTLPRYVKIKILLFLKFYNTTRSIRSNWKLLKSVWRKIWQINSIKSGKCRHLIRKPYCTSFAIYQR